MHRNQGTWPVMLAMAAVGNAVAAPRDQPVLAKAVEVQDATPEEWMQRLQGRFDIEGSIRHMAEIEMRDGRMGAFLPDPDRNEPEEMGSWEQPIASGKADCIGVSESAGLNCLVFVEWAIGNTGFLDTPLMVISPEAPRTIIHNAPRSPRVPMGASSLRPGTVLAGAMPSSPGTVRMLVVDDKGLAHPGSLDMHGNAAIAEPPCVNQPGRMTCSQRFRVEARPGARIVFVTFEIETAYILSRLPSLNDPDARTQSRFEERLVLSMAFRREALPEAPEPAQEPQGSP